MSRPVRLAFLCLACFLVLLPLAFKKPGLPMLLSGDEATYYSMAASLVADGDLRCDRADLGRLFTEFPFTGQARLSLSSDDGWQSVRFDRPVIYPLLAAPWVALWGANGPLALNAALLVAAIFCGWRRLRRITGDGGHALLFCCGFFLFSAAFAYTFRMQPQVMVMAAVTAAMAFGWREPNDLAAPSSGFITRHGGWLSGSALGVAGLQEPALLVLGGPLLFVLWRSRRRDAVYWLAACAVAVGLGALTSIALIGRAWPDHLPSTGAAAEFTVNSPLEMPWLDGPSATRQAGDAEPRRSALALLEDGGFLLWGRRTGALPYFPLIVPILALFAARAHRRGGLLLAALGVLAMAQVIFEPVARATHEGQVGNPHLVGVYPVFLFLLPGLPRVATVVSYGLGTLVLGPLLSATLGGVVPGGGVHGHTRQLPFRLLPFEYPALGRASTMTPLELHGLGRGRGARLWAGADQAEVHGDELWLLGGESVELWLESREPLSSAVLLLRNPASGNRVTMRFGGAEEVWNFEQVPPAGTSVRVDVEPDAPDKVRRDDAGSRVFYRLKIATRLGEKPKWRLESAMSDYVGVGVAFLGSREHLESNLYAARWTGCGAPPSVEPEERFLAAARLRNASDHPWPHRGPARVRLSYRWLDAGGQELPDASSRTELSGDVAPGEDVASWIEVQAPALPGRYVLELDPLFENVAWFSSRDPDAACRVEVEVGPRAET